MVQHLPWASFFPTPPPRLHPGAAGFPPSIRTVGARAAASSSSSSSPGPAAWNRHFISLPHCLTSLLSNTIRYFSPSCDDKPQTLSPCSSHTSITGLSDCRASGIKASWKTLQQIMRFRCDSFPAYLFIFWREVTSQREAGWDFCCTFFSLQQQDPPSSSLDWAGSQDNLDSLPHLPSLLLSFGTQRSPPSPDGEGTHPHSLPRFASCLARVVSGHSDDEHPRSSSSPRLFF